MSQDKGITLSTEKSRYALGEIVRIVGKVTLSDASTPVLVQVLTPEGKRLIIDQPSTSTEGSFGCNFELIGPLVTEGQFRIIATYGKFTVNTTFQLVAKGQIDYPTVINFFFVDIVALSDPKVATTVEQRQKIKVLNECIKSCRTFADVADEAKYILPTGDGMAIGFTQAQTSPIDLAVELHEKLHEYNKGKPKSQQVKVRVGVNTGPVLIVEDIAGNQNVWGDGIIMARRIMDVGDDGHILLSEGTAKDLINHSIRYKKMLRYAGKYDIKHDQKAGVYLATGAKFGNRTPPERKKKKAVIKLKKVGSKSRPAKSRSASSNLQAHYKLLTEESLSKLVYDPKVSGESLGILSDGYYRTVQRAPYLEQIKSHLKAYEELWKLYERGPELAMELDRQSNRLEETQQEMSGRLDLQLESKKLLTVTQHMKHNFVRKLIGSIEDELKYNRPPFTFNAELTADQTEFKIEELVIGGESDARTVAVILNEILRDPQLREKYRDTLNAKDIAAINLTKNVNDFSKILKEEVVERIQASNYTSMKGTCKDCPT